MLSFEGFSKDDILSGIEVNYVCTNIGFYVKLYLNSSCLSYNLYNCPV